MGQFGGYTEDVSIDGAEEVLTKTGAGTRRSSLETIRLWVVGLLGLEDLRDVDIAGSPAPADGAVLRYDAASPARWYADELGTAADLDFDTDTGLAANSDALIATQKAVKAYVDASVVGLWDFKGDTDASANPNYPAALKGDAYVITVAGKIGGGSGKTVEVGDVYVAKADNAGGTEAGVGTSWFVLEHNLVGAAVAGAITSSGLTMATARLLGRTTASSGAVEELTAGTGLVLSAGSLAADTGTSGAKIPLLNAANTHSALASFSAGINLTLAAAPAVNAAGFLGAPQIADQDDYTLALADSGGHYYHVSGTPHTLTIPANGTIAFPIGTVIGIVNENGAGAITLAITTDTLRWGSSTGSRTIAANGTASLLKVTSTVWRLTGDGIT